MKLTEKQLKNFWAKVDIRGEDQCWEWTAFRNPEGYGQVKICSRVQLSHRVSASLAGMNIDNLFVCHTCDNPSCVNPTHLFAGTPADNGLDMHLKGRGRGGSSPGEENKSAKLTADQVLEIRYLYASGLWPLRELAERYRVSSVHIGRIVNRKLWKHI